MSTFRFREEEESGSRSALYLAIGAAAGLAVGILIAEQFGGFRAITDRIRDKFGGADEGLLDEEDEEGGEGFDDDDEDYEDDVDEY